MTAPAITTPPTTPSRTRPTTFSAEMDAYLAWLTTAAPEFTAAALFAEAEALAAQDATMVGWNFSSTTSMADPGSGNIRFNNATLASVTAIAIDDLNSEAEDFSGYIVTWGSNPDAVKGDLIIRQRAGGYAIFAVTAVTDNAGWTELTVTHKTSGGAFVDTDLAGVSYVPRGEDGTPFSWNFSTTTTMADPGAGAMRFNHATIASVTSIAIDNLDSLSRDLSGYINSWTSTDAVKGDISLTQRNGAYAVFNVTETVDETGWAQLTVIHLSSGGAFGDGQATSIVFSRATPAPAPVTYSLVGTTLTITTPV